MLVNENNFDICMILPALLSNMIIDDNSLSDYLI